MPWLQASNKARRRATVSASPVFPRAPVVVVDLTGDAADDDPVVEARLAGLGRPFLSILQDSVDVADLTGNNGDAYPIKKGRLSEPQLQRLREQQNEHAEQTRMFHAEVDTVAAVAYEARRRRQRRLR